MTCAICELVKEKKNIIYEDEKLSVMPAPKPAVPGHIIVVPKKHCAILEQVPDFVIGPMLVQANKFSTKAFELLGAQGTNILVNNGVSAGQNTNHTIMHVLPRRQGDGLKLGWEPKKISAEELAGLEVKIKEEAKTIGEFEKEKPKPIKIKKPEQISEGEGEDYLLKQLERLP